MSITIYNKVLIVSIYIQGGRKTDMCVQSPAVQ